MFLFPMEDFVLFGTYHKSMYFIPTIFLIYKINGVRVPQFQLDYIRNTTHSSHKRLVGLCREVHYMWRGNQYLELQEWEDFIKSNKTRILAIVMLAPKKNPQGYKDHVISFIAFDFGEVVTIIDWISNTKIYVYSIEETYKDTTIGHLGISGASDL